MSAILWKWNSWKKKRQQRAPLTCHHSVDNGCTSLLPISEDWDGVHVLHARSQARHNNASRVWSHFSRGFPSLAWPYTQLEEGKQDKHQGQIFPEPGYGRGAVARLRRMWKTTRELHNVLLLGSELGPYFRSIRYFSWRFSVLRAWGGVGVFQNCTKVVAMKASREMSLPTILLDKSSPHTNRKYTGAFGHREVHYYILFTGRNPLALSLMSY